MINIYLVKYKKLCIVYEEKIVDAYTMEQAIDMIRKDDSQFRTNDSYVVEDVSFHELEDVEHLNVVKESHAV